MFGDFEKKDKGDYAEEIVKNFFLKQGWEIYQPSGVKAHLFDGFAVKLINGVYQLFYYDVKSKAARNISPDTGVDYKHYKHYEEIHKTLGTFLIFFVDEELEKVYYQNLQQYVSEEKKFNLYKDENEVIYPKIEKNKYNNENYIYFSLETMKKLKNLSTTEIKTLKSMYTEKSYTFNPLWNKNNYLL
jgi:hypothetical protein